MKRSTQFLLLLAFLGLAFLLFGLLGHDSQSRRALRDYKANLRARGEKLTYQELAIRHSTNAGGSVAALTNAVARLRMGSFAPSMIEPRSFVRPGYARVRWMEPHPIQEVRGRESTVTWEVVATEMETNRLALGVIRMALIEPPPDSGSRDGVLFPRPVANFVALRSAGQWLAGAVLSDLHQAQHLDALANLGALISMARVNRDEYTLVSQMIRVGISRLGLAITWEALQAPGWTEAEYQRLQHAWEEVDLLEGQERGFLGERAMETELWTLMRSSSIAATRRSLSLGPSNFQDLMSDYFIGPVYKLTSINDDELFYLKSMQQCLEVIRALHSDRSWVEAKPGLDKTISEVSSVASSPQWFRYQFSLMAFPNLRRAAEITVRAETERQLTITAIAIERYRLQHKELPQKLIALIPEFLPSLPADYMNGKVLGYRPRDEGDFVLYSAGGDGRDDGGDPSGGIDMWDGHDAVWPKPASAASEGAAER